MAPRVGQPLSFKVNGVDNPKAPFFGTQSCGFSAQMSNRTGRCEVAASTPALTTKPVLEVSMAEPYPKKILPYLEGKIGELRIMRFWSKVDMRGPDECWQWQASINASGYGRFKIASYNMVTASRMALICTKREEPAGLHVLHHCDNPACCNPHHLYFGTIAQNNADKVNRGRAKTGDQSGANNGAAKLTEDQFALVIQRLKDGWNNKQIAADLPITHSMVSCIRVGKMWRTQSAALGWEPKVQFRRRKAA